MKKVFYSIFAISILLQSCGDATETKTEATEAKTEVSSEEVNHEEELAETEELVIVDGYTYFGIKDMDAQGALSMEEMIAKVEETGTFEGKINAKLTGVCKKAGCWVTIENPNGDPIRVVFGEHDFFVPTDTPEDKEVILEGMASIDTTSVELQKHFLDDAKEAGEEVSQAEYDAITEDLVEISFNATGILIK